MGEVTFLIELADLLKAERVGYVVYLRGAVLEGLLLLLRGGVGAWVKVSKGDGCEGCYVPMLTSAPGLTMMVWQSTS